MGKAQKSGEPEISLLRQAKEVLAVEQYWHPTGRSAPRKPPKDYKYVEELADIR